MLKEIIGKQLDFTGIEVQGLTNEEIKLLILDELGLECNPDEFQAFTTFKKADLSLKGQRHTFRCPIWYPVKGRKKDEKDNEDEQDKTRGFFHRTVYFFHISQANKK